MVDSPYSTSDYKKKSVKAITNMMIKKLFCKNIKVRQDHRKHDYIKVSDYR